MKIVSLLAENVKKLVAVEITPDGNLVQITGRNGQGKSSVLDSIWWALSGASHIQSAPIRKGANTARIRLDLGEIVVTRTFSRKGDAEYTSQISVENADGARFPSPQKMLDSLLGALTFDPLEFARSESKKQFELARALVPGVDFDAIQKAHDADFERRREINRFAKEARASASMIVVPADTPSEAIDENALVAELEKAGEHNTQLEQRKARRQVVAQEIETMRANNIVRERRITELQEEINNLRSLIESAKEIITGSEAKLAAADALPAPIDTSAIRAQIDRARIVNANVTKLATKVKHEHLAMQYEQESQELTERIEARQEQKRAAIADANMPVPGLTFGEGAVLLNGLPFDQASDAEQLRASVAIAMAMNPKLRVLRIRDGSLLDEDSMRILSSMCDTHDFQCWIEVVDSSGKVGIIIEDGMVKGAASKDEAVAA